MRFLRTFFLVMENDVKLDSQNLKENVQEKLPNHYMY